MKPGVMSDVRTIALTAVATAVIVSTALLWQNYRQGWPFTKQSVEPRSSAAGAVISAEPAVMPKASARTPINLETTKLEELGVRFERAQLERIAQPVRAVATVVADERRISHVHTRFSGWLEQLYVSTTGEVIRAGQPLAAVFSQELYASQNEYLAVLRQSQSGLSSSALEAGRLRLELLGMTAAEIRQIENTGQARRLVTVVSPHRGVVLRRGAAVGAAIDPSTEILTIADLSSVWVLAEVPEGQATGLTRGASATLNFSAAGRGSFPARIDFIYPTLTERTRTLRVRFVVANADGHLRPGLYGTAEFAPTRRETLTIPRDALVDTGESQHVFVRASTGELAPRAVSVGVRMAERVEITKGLTPDEEIVAAGVFLIDSESRLRASGVGSEHAGHGSAPKTPTEDAPDRSRSVAPAGKHSDHGS